MNKFYKVSYEQYKKDNPHTSISEYEGIKLPRRATKGSAGYDFFAPYDITLQPGEDITIATGIRVEIDEDKFLACFPRSGLGFKYKLQLANTTGVIDSDYFYAKNEGHVHAKICNNGDKTVHIKEGEAFMQGIFLQYFKTVDDDASGIRTGGMGSTSK